ncbi:hypothetical protein N9K77_01815 [bacterium]|nr:hypothetical protein [bacterium]
MEIKAQAFAFATNDEVNSMTFYNYELINRSYYTLNNTYFAVWVDSIAKYTFVIYKKITLADLGLTLIYETSLFSLFWIFVLSASKNSGFMAFNVKLLFFASSLMLFFRANENDQDLSKKLDVVDIKGDHAIWKNSWDAARCYSSVLCCLYLWG